MSSLVAQPKGALAPATSLRGVVQNCRVEALPAGSAWWEDLSSARNDHAMQVLGKVLLWSDSPTKAVLFGHRGGGKTTEIFRLLDNLKEQFFPIYVEATEELDTAKFQTEDLLLILASMIESKLRENDTPLRAESLGRVLGWFDEVVKNTAWRKELQGEVGVGAEVGVDVPFFARIFASVKSLMRYDTEYRTEVKREVRKQPGALLNAVNLLIDEANLVLAPKRLLVVVDNLDRCDPAVIDEVLLRDADMVKALRCPIILTPPMDLLLRPKTDRIEAAYNECHALFAVRLRRPEQPYRSFDGPGRDLLLGLLRKRVDLDRVMPDSEARDRLIAACGGAVRELFDLLSASALLSAGDQIRLSDVESAIRARRGRMRDMINVNGWHDALATIARTKQLAPDRKCEEVYFYGFAFKYNGDNWYDIHPLAAELPEVDAAIRRA